MSKNIKISIIYIYFIKYLNLTLYIYQIIKNNICYIFYFYFYIYFQN